MNRFHTWLSALLVFTGAASAVAVTPAPMTRSERTAEQAPKPTITLKPSAQAPTGISSPFVLRKGMRPLASNPMAGRISSGVKKAPSCANEDMPDLRGCLLTADSWNESYAPYGLYKIPMSPSEQFEQTLPEVNAQTGGVAAGKYYYATSHFSMMGIPLIFVSKFDLETGEMVYQYNPPYLQTEAADLTYDATTKTVYGINYDMTQTKWTFSTVDYGEEEVTVSKITDLDGDWNAIAADKDGVIYGIKKQLYDLGGMKMCIGSTLVRFNKETGSYTEIGETGQTPHYMSSATIDPQSNRMFWTVSCQDGLSKLCEVDLQSGEATELNVFSDGEKVVGLYVAVPAAADNAPAAPENLSLSFPSGSLSGTVTFDIPARLYSGEAASGAVTYTVEANETAVASGQSTFGASGVSVPVTLQTTGMTTFSVYLTNDGGESARATAECFVGDGIPMTPTNVKARHDGTTMTVSWDAVTASADGGYVDPSAITYTVTEMPAGTVIAESISGTTTARELAIPEDLTPYYYTVTATYNGLTSPAARSNSVPLGAITPPYNQPFDSEESLAYFTIIDANGDGRTWEYAYGETRVEWNETLDMDDWMISAPVKMEAGNAYHITARIRSSYIGFTERFEIKAGTAPEPSAMTTTVVAPTEVADNDEADAEGYFVPPVTGKYYIGLHGISDANMARLYLDNFTITAGSSAARPAAPDQFEVTADPMGEHKVTIRVTAPTTDVSGAPLPVLTKAELLRDGVTVNTWHNPAPGSELTFTDTPSGFGDMTYTLKGHNDAGEGVAIQQTVFVGTPVPSYPRNVTLEELEQPGYVRLSWNPIDTDRDGQPINPAKALYSVYGFNNGIPQVIIATELDATELTFYAGNPNVEQFFLQYVVFGTTESGNGMYTTSKAIPYGTPHQGYSNSFANGEAEMLTGMRPVEYGNWYLCTDATFGDIQAADGDNGFIIHEGAYPGWSGAVYTGKISLAGTDNPAISFYSFPTSTNDENTLDVRVREYGKEWQSVMCRQVKEFGTAAQWHKVVVPIPEFKGKIIQVEIIATTVTSAFTPLDAITVGNIPDHDIAVTAVKAPASAACGSDFDIEATLANHGAKPMEAFDVELYADGNKVQTQRCPATAPGSTAKVTFRVTMPRLASEPVAYTVVAASAQDLNPANDRSETTSVSPVLNNLPPVENLNATEEESSVTLAWDAPTLDRASICQVTETFASGQFGDTSYPGWTFVDEDGVPMGGFGSVELPGLIPGETPSSFFVIDSDHPSLNPSFAPREGASDTKYLASVYNSENTAISDWLISPRLSGEAQTISFYARSYDESMPEQCEALYSTGGTELQEFTSVKMFQAMFGRWLRYEFDVPEGANYFAVRSCAVGAFLFFIDDLTYIPYGAEMPVMQGYNVYRDDTLLTPTPVIATTYTDSGRPAGTHTYAVTAVFDTGESRASKVRTGQVGIQAATATALRITGTQGAVIISGGQGETVTVITPDGRTAAAAKAGDHTRISLEGGIYLVKAGETTVKVHVR